MSDATEIAAVMAVLDKHRWKSMGVSSVECECGEIVYGDGEEPLTQFPADEAFRRHIAVEVTRVLLPVECNCGWGGVHDPDNPRCSRNGAIGGRE